MVESGIKAKQLLLEKYNDTNYGYLRIHVDKEQLRIGFHQVGASTLAQSRYDMVTVDLAEHTMVADYDAWSPRIAEKNRPAEEPGDTTTSVKRVLLVRATMMPVTADWLSTRQLKSRHRGNDIEAGLALQAQRLQSERIVKSADQPVGAAADAHGRTGRGANITAVQCALPDTGGQREDGPAEDHVIAKPGLGPKP